MPLEVDMAKITIDGIFYEVKPGKNLLETCLGLGMNIPHFCFHPAMGSVGACRLCAVKKFRDQNDTRGKIVMSCMEPVTDGLIVSIEDEDVITFRAAVIEGLMTNHPHDCPVCDEGGECHLQDMTIMTGHNYRHFDFKKRSFNNQYLGPFLAHEMNRCIECYRCVRFYRNYAGGKDLNVFSAHNHVYFGRHKDGILENEFSGNLAEVCPTGVFTDKTLKRHFTRKWDLTNSPSICVHCSIGCNIIASERYNSLRRVSARYNGAVNGYFICDRGRFGYEFVNSNNRIRKVYKRNAKNEEPDTTEIKDIIPYLNDIYVNEKLIMGIGSPRASIESNYLLSVLTGKDNFYHGISENEYLLTGKVVDFLKKSGVHNPSLKQIEKADAVLIFGEDLVNSAPMMALAVRQAIRNKPLEMALKKGIPAWEDAAVSELAQDSKSPVYIATTHKDSLDEIAQHTIRGTYSQLSDLGFYIATLISEKAPAITIEKGNLKDIAQEIAHTLTNARNPLIISGISCGDEGMVDAALNISNAMIKAGKDVMLSMVLPECNSMGLALLPGRSLDDAFSFAAHNTIDTLLILENDLYRRAKESKIDALLNKSKQIIVIDHLFNKTSSKADILLPATTFAESQGTLVSNEGRAQRFYRAVPGADHVRESWQWLSNIISSKNNSQNSMNGFDDIVESLCKDLPVFAKLKDYMPDADFRMLNTKIPRQTLRFSGRTAINAHNAVSEQKVPNDPDSPLAFTMEGQPEKPPSSLIPFYWTPGWNSVQAMYAYLDEPNGSMKGGDPGINIFEKIKGRTYPFFKKNNNELTLQENEFLIVPVFRIFGSEELSSASSSVSERIENPSLYLNQDEAMRLGTKEDDMLRIDISDTTLNIKVRIDNSLAMNLAGITVNVPGIQFLELPATGKLFKT